jgi:osmotically inducible protein OsmC
MDKIKLLFTATATASGGRNGHTEASGLPPVTPPVLGVRWISSPSSTKGCCKGAVTCAVSIGPRDGGGFGLAVTMRVEDKSLPQDELGALLQ